jgi:hypothetical protein
VPREWIAKDKGRFDQGWDKLRQTVIARQKELGIIPPGTKLARKPNAIRDWDSLTSDERKLFARQMEVYAGFAEMADYETGRLIQTIGDLGQLDNTLVRWRTIIMPLDGRSPATLLSPGPSRSPPILAARAMGWWFPGPKESPARENCARSSIM